MKEQRKSAPAVRANPSSTAAASASISKEAAPASSPSIRASPASFPIRIQVSSSRNRKNAEAEADRLAKAGLQAEIEASDLGENGVWYRVRLAGFRSRRAATETAASLQSKGLIQEFWLVR